MQGWLREKFIFGIEETADFLYTGWDGEGITDKFGISGGHMKPGEEDHHEVMSRKAQE